ncbi:D-aminoacyl-tRNA deacylase [Paenibacillus taiwanensis]|uniref:D-aminoacyl-tRNA deacylase n=1 Tax=Paenibacillus taiwanensis TaxID=401638 RepID=UPI0004131E51|nr:D-aminoacyl-tRNA deacylase [Paenibacillus taiwanensis]
MKIVVQRSKAAKVIVNQETVGEINKGLVLLVGVTHEDTEQDAQWLADKIAGLRIFEDEHEKMNFSVQDIGGAILSVSQFTLFGDCRKGRRPNFMAAARPEQAEQLYTFFNECLRKHNLPVSTGTFGAMMDVQFTNWGPVTLILDSQSR